MKYNSIDIIVPIGGNKPADQVMRCLKSVKHAILRCRNEGSKYYSTEYKANCICVFTNKADMRLKGYKAILDEIRANEFKLVINDQDYSDFHSASIGRYLGVLESEADVVTYSDCDDMVSNDICIYTLDAMNTFNSDLLQTSIIEHPELSIRYPTILHRSSKWNVYSLFNKYDDAINMMAMYAMSRLVANNVWADILKVDDSIFSMNFGEDVVEHLSLLKNAKRAKSTHHITYMYFLYQGVCNDTTVDTNMKKLDSIEIGYNYIKELSNELNANKFKDIYDRYLIDIR